MCERATRQRLMQMGQDGRYEQITEETSSLSSTDESVIKHPDALAHTHARTHTQTGAIPTFLPTSTGMASSPVEI